MESNFEKNKKRKKEQEGVKRENSGQFESDLKKEEKKEKGGLIKGVLKETFLKISGIKAVNSWREYLKVKKEKEQEGKRIEEKRKVVEKLSEESNRALDKFREKYYLDDFGRLNFFTEYSEKWLEKNKDLDPSELRKKWNEKLERVEEKLKRRQERRNEAKAKVVERFNSLDKESRLKKIEAVSESVYAAGMQASWFSGAVALVGLGARLSAPVLKSLAQAKVEGNLREKIERSISAFYKKDMNLKERIGHISGFARQAFTIWAAERGFNNFFGEGELSGSNFRTGFGSLIDLFNKDNLASNLSLKNNSEIKNDSNVIESDNGIDRYIEEIKSEIKEKIISESEPFNFEKRLEGVNLEIKKGEGAISFFERFKKEMLDKYSDIPYEERPTLIQDIFQSSPAELAKKYGFYNPGSIKESALLLEGDKLVFSDKGLEFIRDGKRYLLDSDGGASGERTSFIGKMFDFDGNKAFEINDNEVSFESVDNYERILNSVGVINALEVANYAKKLAGEGVLTQDDWVRLREAFYNNVSEGARERLNAGYGDIEITADQYRKIISDSFNIEISEEEFAQLGNIRFNTQDFNQLLYIYSDPQRELTKDVVLSQLSGKTEVAESLSEADRVYEDILKRNEGVNTYLTPQELKEEVLEIKSEIDRYRQIESRNINSNWNKVWEAQERVRALKSELVSLLNLSDNLADSKEIVKSLNLESYLTDNLNLSDKLINFLNQGQDIFNQNGSLEIQRILKEEGSEIEVDWDESQKMISFKLPGGKILHSPIFGLKVEDGKPFIYRVELEKAKIDPFMKFKGALDLDKGGLNLAISYIINSLNRSNIK